MRNTSHVTAAGTLNDHRASIRNVTGVDTRVDPCDTIRNMTSEHKFECRASWRKSHEIGAKEPIYHAQLFSPRGYRYYALICRACLKATDAKIRQSFKRRFCAACKRRIYYHRGDTRRAVFCDDTCRMRVVAAQRRAARHAARPATITCVVCKKEFPTPRRAADARYCSVACRMKAYRLRAEGKEKM